MCGKQHLEYYKLQSNQPVIVIIITSVTWVSIPMSALQKYLS